MPLSTFSVFLDDDTSGTTYSSSSKPHRPPSCPLETKENLNPLTGLSFEAQIPQKKRKPSSSSVLKVKPLSSSSKPTFKCKRNSSSNIGKDKGMKRAVLGSRGNKNAADRVNESGGSDVEQLRTALGNRRAYDFTVMPLANITQAYGEGEETRTIVRADDRPIGDWEPKGMTLEDVTEEDVEMCNMTSKEAATSVPVTEV